MLEILNSTKKEIKKNLQLLAKDYKEKTGRVVCLSCPSDIQYMISSLKIIYKMKNFQFKKHSAQYKNAKGDKTTISNETLTDEKAIQFLKTNPERIRLFSKFPENWKELIKGKQLTEEEKQAKVAEESAEEEARKAKGIIEEAEGLVDGGIVEEGQVDLVDSIKEIEVDSEEVLSAEEEARKASQEAMNEANGVQEEKEDCCDDHDEKEPCEDCKKKKHAELMKMKLADLRTAYPEIKASSIKDFADKVINN